MSTNDIYLQSGEIIPIPISDVSLGITVGLIRSNRYAVSQVEKEFIEALKSMCEIAVPISK